MVDGDFASKFARGEGPGISWLIEDIWQYLKAWGHAGACGGELVMKTGGGTP